MKEIYEQLSNREKTLLYILICFLIVVAGWFLLITPSLDKKSSLEQEYQNILAENTKKQTELSQYLAAPDELKAKKESLEEIIKKYNPQLTNEKIDKLLTTAFLTNGLKPISLAISDVKAASVTSTKDDTKKEDEATASAYVTQATANVSVSGTLAQITNTIDTLNKMSGVEISSFTYTPSTNVIGSRATSATLTIIVYMTSQ